MRGRFITFEGPEGGGKSTHSKLLAERLRARGLEVVETREPGGTELAEKIRALVREQVSDSPVPRAETLLFLAARAQNVERVIKPALERGAWVLCDRFSDSTMAYQGHGRGFGMERIAGLDDFATGGLKPDLTFLLDVPPETSAERLSGRQAAGGEAPDRMELAGAAFHRAVREGFLALAALPENRGRIVVIDATRPPQETAAAVEKALTPLLIEGAHNPPDLRMMK